MSKKLYTTAEIAQHCQVTDRAVLKWITAGKIKAFRTPGRHTRINEEDFLSFLNTYQMPIPSDLNKGSTKRILVVEDDQTTVEIIKNILRKEDLFSVQVAYDGFTAGLIFNEFKPDLITLDIRMPMVNGFEVCAYIRKNYTSEQVKILVVSALSDEETKTKILNLGADDYIVKPFSAAVLTEKIENLLAIKV